MSNPSLRKARPAPPRWLQQIGAVGSWVLLKLEALAWVLSASLVLVYGNGQYDFLTAVMQHADSVMPWLWVAGAALGINLSLFAYVMLWLGVLNKVPHPERRVPWALPTASGAMVVGFFATLRAIWPAFGFFSLLTLPILCMAAIMSFHFLPSFGFLRLPPLPPPSITKQD